MASKTTAYSADLPSLVERYFCEYLIQQRNASPETISNYRDAFRLFLRFSEQQFGKAPATLTLADFDAPQVLAFLDTLESQRHSSVRSRNARLAALRSFLQYAALQEPAALATISHTLAIPVKRFDRVPVSYLSREEIIAILEAPNRETWSGHRDAVMLAAMYNTGARVSEISDSTWKICNADLRPRCAFTGRDEKSAWFHFGRTRGNSSLAGFAGSRQRAAHRSSRAAAASA